MAPLANQDVQRSVSPETVPIWRGRSMWLSDEGCRAVVTNYRRRRVQTRGWKHAWTALARASVSQLAVVRVSNLCDKHCVSVVGTLRDAHSTARRLVELGTVKLHRPAACFYFRPSTSARTMPRAAKRDLQRIIDEQAKRRSSERKMRSYGWREMRWIRSGGA